MRGRDNWVFCSLPLTIVSVGFRASKGAGAQGGGPVPVPGRKNMAACVCTCLCVHDQEAMVLAVPRCSTCCRGGVSEEEAGPWNIIPVCCGMCQSRIGRTVGRRANPAPNEQCDHAVRPAVCDLSPGWAYLLSQMDPPNKQLWREGREGARGSLCAPG